MYDSKINNNNIESFEMFSKVSLPLFLETQMSKHLTLF